MYERMNILKKADLDRLHENTLRIFEEIGIAFHTDKALDIFQRNDIRVDDGKVYLKPHHIENALKTVPAEFTLHGRNPDTSVRIGGGNLVLAPGYGAPFMVTEEGQRRSVLNDYINFCKLVQTSKSIEMTGILMGDPSDRPAEKAHLDMVFANLTCTDKPFIGSSASETAAKQSIEMAGIAWGGMEKIEDKAVTMGVISALSPLSYSCEMAEALIEFARCGQANLVCLLAQAGSTAPVTLQGLLAVQNAEMLAGLVLTQLVNPGAPVIYGGTSTVTDMRTGGLAVGAPEFSLIQNATVQMGKYYGVPTRGNGGITDTHCLDMQAGVESTMALASSVMSGANFILHGCGILSSYLSMSYEKFLADEEIYAMLKRMVAPFETSDERIAFDIIKTVGCGGEYLTHPHTFQHCRTEFYQPQLFQRNDFSAWKTKGSKTVSDLAGEKIDQRLAAWEKPEIDPDIEARLSNYVESNM